ncbi:hypothetical protein Tco_0603500 [Tanacetum coccineum]
MWEIPFLIMLKLTIPKSSPSEWNRFYRSANIALCPLALIFINNGCEKENLKAHHGGFKWDGYVMEGAMLLILITSGRDEFNQVTWRLKRAKDQKISRLGGENNMNTDVLQIYLMFISLIPYNVVANGNEDECKKSRNGYKKRQKRKNDVRLNEKTVEKVTRRSGERGECREKEEA